MKLSFTVMLALGLSACNSQNQIPVSSVQNPSSESTASVETRGGASSTPAPGAVQQTATPGAASGSTSGTTSGTTSGSTPVTLPSSTPIPSPTPVVQTPRGNIGLVWNGAGACTDGCALGAATSVTQAGLSLKYINEKTLANTDAQAEALFAGARVWVMPGGVSNQEVTAMTPALQNALRNFVQSGGGYVGYCAGAFASTQLIGTTGQKGLGLFPGNTKLYLTSNKQNNYGASIEELVWANQSHYFYLEGGPSLENLPSTVEVMARYDDRVKVASARTAFGFGRVYVTGVHPEAPIWWWSGTSIKDSDGSDAAYAADMVRWAAHLSD